MQEDNQGAEGFDGVFRFTNWLDETFTTKWNNVEYTFPALKTTPLIIPNATPEEVQNIRKKFARDLATFYFYNTDKFKSMDLSIEDSQAGKTPALYTDDDLAPYIQKCLEPLPAGRVTSKVIEKPLERIIESKGKKASKVIDPEETASLVGDGTVVA